MSGDPPVDRRDVRAYAEAAGVAVDGADLDAFRASIADLEATLAALDGDAIPDPGPPPVRDHREPDPDADPHGAFLARCSIAPTGSGPLDGMDVAAKDNLAVAGLPMTCGSELLAGFVPPADATVVERLLDSGGRFVGKTNMDAFAYGGDPDTMRFRLARNPHDPERMPGYTSSGSAVAVAEGLADVALGTDTGGSVRFPAAWCGVVGLKPTRGLVSHHGLAQFGKTVDAVGPLARSTEAAARGLAAIAGEDPRDERTRGARTGDYLDGVATADPADLVLGRPAAWDAAGEDAVLEVAGAALSDLEAAGATVREVSIPGFDLALPAWFAIALTELGAYVRHNGLNVWLLSRPDEALSAALRGLERPVEHTEQVAESLVLAEHLAAAHGDRYYGRAQRAREVVAAGVDDALDGVDALALPTVPTLPPTWEEGAKATEIAANVAPFNLSGHPAISVPCGAAGGLPVGLQFVGERFDEAATLRAAACVEAVRGAPAP